MDDNELTEESLIAVDSRSETPSENGDKRSQGKGRQSFFKHNMKFYGP